MKAYFFRSWENINAIVTYFERIEDCPHCIMLQDKHFKFTKRIKYISNEHTNINRMYLEVSWWIDGIQEKNSILDRILFAKPKFNIEPPVQIVKWIPEDAFGFDYHDDTVEVIYKCEN